jgi:Spy/CpxP family protein refolding chaperone
MKTLVTSLVVLVFAASLSFAQGMIQEKGEKSEEEIGMLSMKGGMSSTMCNMIVHHVFIKANTLNLTDAQRKELANILDKYLYPMAHREGDSKISHKKVMDMLQDPNFDPAKLKAEVKASNDINLEIENMSVDALAAIRKAIGVENFKKAEMMPMMSGGMTKGETTVGKEALKH